MKNLTVMACIFALLQTLALPIGIAGELDGGDPDRELRRQPRAKLRQQKRFERKKKRVLAFQDRREKRFFRQFDREFKRLNKKIHKALTRYNDQELVEYTRFMIAHFRQKKKLEEAALLESIQNDPKEIREHLKYFVSEANKKFIIFKIKENMKKAGGFLNYMHQTQRKKRIGCWIGNIGVMSIGLFAGIGIVGFGLIFGIGYPIQAVMTGAWSLGAGVLSVAGTGAGALGFAGLGWMFWQGMGDAQRRCEWNYREFTGK